MPDHGLRQVQVRAGHPPEGSPQEAVADRVKEIKFRPKIDPHDYATKKGHVERFLQGGSKVKVTIMFRGREMAHTELGRKILDRLVVDLGDMVVVESMPKQDGRNMIMVIAPTRSKETGRHRGAADKARPRPSSQPATSRPPRCPEAEAAPTRRRIDACRR